MWALVRSTSLHYRQGFLYLLYKNDDDCYGLPGRKMETLISFICDHTVSGNGQPRLERTSDCTHYVTWRTPLACEAEVSRRTNRKGMGKGDVKDWMGEVHGGIGSEQEKRWERQCKAGFPISGIFFSAEWNFLLSFLKLVPPQNSQKHKKCRYLGNLSSCVKTP